MSSFSFLRYFIYIKYIKLHKNKRSVKNVTIYRLQKKKKNMQRIIKPNSYSLQRVDIDVVPDKSNRGKK